MRSPTCSQCNTTKDLVFSHSYNDNQIYICEGCKLRRKKRPISKLHRSMRSEEWDKLANEINGRIMRRG